MRLAFCVLLGLSMTGCATIVTGTSQPVAIESEPPGAACLVSQGGYQIGAVPSTPGYVSVPKSSESLNVSCSKPGYRTAQQSVPFGLQGWLFGNAVIGGLVGVVVDFSTGAAYKYAPGTMLALSADPNARVAAANLPVRVYASSAGSDGSNPLVVQPTTAGGDVTYVWAGPTPH